MRPHARWLGVVVLSTGAGAWFTTAARPMEDPVPPIPYATEGGNGAGNGLKRKGYRVLPLQRRPNSNYLWLTADVAGQELTMILDSAAAQTTLDRAAAERLKLPMTAHGKLSSFGGDVPAFASFWPTLKLGRRDLQLPYLAVLDFAPMNKAPEDQADGVLGADVLNQYAAVIDFAAPALYLLEKARGQDELQGEWRGVQVEHLGGLFPVAHANRYRFVFDGLTFRYKFGETITEARIVLNPYTTPKQITWYVAEGRCRMAIYEVKDGKLRVAAPAYDGDLWDRRPTTFNAPRKGGFAVITLERVAGK